MTREPFFACHCTNADCKNVLVIKLSAIKDRLQCKRANSLEDVMDVFNDIAGNFECKDCQDRFRLENIAFDHLLSLSDNRKDNV